MKKHKKYQEYYEQRKLINSIIKNPKILDRVISRGITEKDFKDGKMRIVFCWYLEKYKENKEISPVSTLIKAHRELKDKVGNLNKYIPLKWKG